MGEFRLSISGYLAHEVRILQDNVRIFDPSQPDQVRIPFIFLSFAASHDSHTCKRLEEGQIPHFDFWCFISFSGPLQFLPCILAGTL